MLNLSRGFVAILAVCVVAAFGPVLWNGFTNWDDGLYLLENTSIRHLGWDTIAWAFSTFRLGCYQPLSWLALAAQHACGELRPWVYHLISLVLHVMNAVLLYAVNLRILGLARAGDSNALRKCAAPAALAVAFYAVHPQRAEVVAWVTAQNYLFSSMGLLTALLLYLDSRADPSRRRWDGKLAAALVSQGVSLLCGPMAVVLPALLLVLDYYPLRRFRAGDPGATRPSNHAVLLEKVPFVALSLVFALLAVQAKRSVGAVERFDEIDLGTRAVQPGYVAIFYPAMALAPMGFSPYYPRPRDLALASPAGIASIAISLGLWAAALLARKRHPGLLAALAAYFVVLAPHIGFVQIGSVLTADRYSYLAMMVWTVPLAFGFMWASDRLGSTRLRLVALGIALAGLSVLIASSREQVRVWRDSESLWKYVLARGGGTSAIVRNQAGIAFAERGHLDESIEQFSESIRLAPNFVKAHENLGDVLIQKGQADRGLDHLFTASRLDPSYSEAHRKLGVALASLGRTQEAESELGKAVHLDPDSVPAQLSLGRFHLSHSREKVAIPFLLAAARLEPESADAHLHLGVAHLRIGDRERAVSYLRLAVRQAPKSAETHNELGIGLLVVGDLDGAIRHSEEAIRLKRAYPEAHNNLGVAHARRGQYHEASRQFSEAIRLRPDFAMAHSNLGSALARLGRRSEAEAEFREALRLQPDLERASRGLAELEGSSSGAR